MREFEIGKMAKSKGLRLIKSNDERDDHNQGKYRLIDRNNGIVLGREFDATEADVLWFLSHYVPIGNVRLSPLVH